VRGGGKNGPLQLAPPSPQPSPTFVGEGVPRSLLPNISMSRCPWAQGERYIAYHDEEWGVPVGDDRTLFEFLILEGAQAGLSWSTILNKRENYRQAFDAFDAAKVARYTPRKIENCWPIRASCATA
jgi:Methyladenine glycosylase